MTTKDQIQSLKRNNPALTQKDIAGMTGVSKQYVSIIMKRAGLEWKGLGPPPIMQQCALEGCSNSFVPVEHKTFCSTKHWGLTRRKEYCRRGHLMAETRREWNDGKVYCIECNRERARIASRARQPLATSSRIA